MKERPVFFDFAAEVGLTKHIGGITATEALCDLCHIDRDKYVLDVGCGVGVTPCYIAQKYSCRVMGVDISARMIERSLERADKEQLADRVDFRVADAQDLPFETAEFDAVITESVTAFPANKQQAVNEYVRVTKPGGYVGLNESTWLKTPPPPEVQAWVEQDIGTSVQPLPVQEWVSLLENAGLKAITAQIFEVDTQDEAREILRRYGLGGMLRVAGRMMALYARSPAYRDFVKGVREQGIIPECLNEYFGYGLFVGQK